MMCVLACLAVGKAIEGKGRTPYYSRINRRSYLSAHALLNLLNDLGKSNKC